MDSELSSSNTKPGFEELSVDLHEENITADLLNKLKEKFFYQTYLSLILNFKGAKKLEAQNLLPSKLLYGLTTLVILLSGIDPDSLEGSLFESAPENVKDVSIDLSSMQFNDKTNKFYIDTLKNLRNARKFELNISNAVQTDGFKVVNVLFECFYHLRGVTLLKLDISQTEIDWTSLGVVLKGLINLKDLTLKSEDKKTTDVSLECLSKSFKISQLLSSVRLLFKGTLLTKKALQDIKEQITSTKKLQLEFIMIELDHENTKEIAKICSEFPSDSKLHGLCIVNNEEFKIGKGPVKIEATKISLDITNSTADSKMSQNQSFSRDDTINYLKGTLIINKTDILGLQAEEGPLLPGENQIQIEEDGTQTEEEPNLSIRSTQSSEEFKPEKWPFNQCITEQQDLNLSVQGNEGEVNPEIQVLNQTVDSPSNEERKRLFELYQGLSSNKESLESQKGLNSYGQTFNPAYSPRHQCEDST